MEYEVTIGVPVYRTASYIETALRSALDQHFEGIELLVIDDQGGDGSMDVVARLQRDHRRGHDIRVLHNDRNVGVAQSRNRIIDEARGRWLYFLDADDTMGANAIELLWQRATSCQAQLAYGSMERTSVGSNQTEVSYAYPDVQLIGDDRLAAFVFADHGRFQSSVCNCLISLDFLRSSGLRFGNARYWEDTTFTYAMAIMAKRAVLLPEVTYCYRRHDDSLSNYQRRDVLPKVEVSANVATIDAMKQHYPTLADKHYIGDYCYTVQSYSFYIVSHVLRNRHAIEPAVSNNELHDYMRFPMPIGSIVRFDHRRSACLLLWLLAHLPACVLPTAMRIISRLRNLRS